MYMTIVQMLIFHLFFLRFLFSFTPGSKQEIDFLIHHFPKYFMNQNLSLKLYKR